MILPVNYEEISALRAGARACLDRQPEEAGAVAAPDECRAQVEAILPRLEGDLMFTTLGELREVLAGIAAIVECLRVEMESSVLATHAADEGAVSAYFDFAHAFTVADRLRELESEMEALIELVTGSAPTDETAGTFVFPD